MNGTSAPVGARVAPWLQVLLFANWHYGAAVVALSVETCLQLGLPFRDAVWAVAAALLTVLYYTHAYRGHRHADASDPRQRWYARHHRAVERTQVIGALLLACLLAWGWQRCGEGCCAADRALVLVLFLCGAAALAYPWLRKGPWKPVVIAFVWAGLVTLLPVELAHVCQGAVVANKPLLYALFAKNWLFVAVLCMLFDIKDHANDHRGAMRTVVVQRGLRATLFKVLLPLSLLGMAVFLVFGVLNGAGPWRVLLNMVPFVFLVVVVRSLRRRRPLWYYLLVVDGLLMLKGVCGSLAALVG